MSADTALPIELLREIRDAVNRASDRPGERIDNVEKKLGDRIDATNQRLETLEKRTTQGFTETNTKLADLTGRVDRMGEEIHELREGMAKRGDRIENILTRQLGQDGGG